MTNVQHYRKKPIVIQAIQYTGENTGEIHDFTCEGKCNGLGNFSCNLQLIPNNVSGGPPNVQIWNELEHQWINLPSGHYIIKGLKGEFYPCEGEVFQNSYERVTDGD